VRSFSLRHKGDCLLLGVTPDHHVYVEEIYGADGWIAQHHYDPDGTLIESIDESDGQITITAPLTLPDNALKSASGWGTMWLNFAGPRHRGIRALERIDQLVRPFTLQDKIHLSTHPLLDLPAPHILGLAESYVLSEAHTAMSGLYLVCRRLRIAYLVIPPGVDEQGEAYDYDTRVLHIAHFAARTPSLDESLIDQMQPLPGIVPTRPMDCVISGDHLFIADGGGDTRLSAVHVWRLEWGVPLLTPDEKLFKQIYG